MGRIINRLKQRLYFSATVFFPAFFKKRFFTNLHKAFTGPKYCHLLPEKEMLVLYFLLHDGHVAVDIGANNGAYSYFFKEIKDAEVVYAFEPLPNLYSKLKAWFSNIQLFNLALSNKREKAFIHIPIIDNRLYESRAKLDNLKEVNETGFREIAIQTDTLDQVLESVGANQLDIVKIDIEGHELKAIEGARKSIEKFRPFLLVELESRHHNNKLTEPVEIICNLNYQAFYFNYASKAIEPFSQFNHLLMQDPSKQNTFNYINNFLFFPIEKMDELTRINQEIKNYFK